MKVQKFMGYIAHYCRFEDTYNFLFLYYENLNKKKDLKNFEKIYANQEHYNKNFFPNNIYNCATYIIVLL